MIRNLKPRSITEFTGKNTTQNLAAGLPGSMLSAKNVLVLADNQVRRTPGYTLVANLGVGPVRSIYDFERTVDAKQYVMVQTADRLVAMQADGSMQQALSTGESSDSFQFVQNAFVCYGSNGDNAWRFVDDAGAFTKFGWGIAAPTEAPTLTLAAGTLTLTFGRRYVFSYVAKYTDSLGIERVHVGAPSPMSAHSGPATNQTPTLAAIPTSTDAQVTHVWIFETSDSPDDTSATFYFAAEITNGTSSYGDTLTDDQLDSTKLAPFDNNPAPPSGILTTFSNRVVAVNQNQIRLSGYDEITLGIPEESWPLDLFFNIPAGSREATAAIALSQGTALAVDTVEAKYKFTGYDATTFTEQDKAATPGAVGKWAQVLTPFGVAFLSESKRLFMWDGANSTTEVSADISQSFPGTYGMEDLTDLPDARLLWYSYGRQHYIVLLGRTSDAPDSGLNLMQIWSIPIKGSQSSGEYTGSSGFFNQIGGLYETDKLAAVSFTAAALVKVDSVPYLFLGDANGKIYRFPDGYTDAGVPFLSNFSTAWSDLGYDGKKRFYFVDLVVDGSLAAEQDGGAVQDYKLFASVVEAPTDSPAPIEIPLTLMPCPEGQTGNALRGSLQVEGLAVGRYLRLWCNLPQTADDEVVLKISVSSAPLYAGAP